MCIISPLSVHGPCGLQVAATDGGTPPLSSSSTVTVTVIDVNDNPPVFSFPNYSFTVAENGPASTIVGVVQVTDVDFGPAADVLLSLSGQNSERWANFLKKCNHLKKIRVVL